MKINLFIFTLTMLNYLAAFQNSEVAALGNNIKKHPLVQFHNDIPWYQNWLTCDICLDWVDIFKDIATQEQFIKPLKGFLWVICATTYS